MGQQWRAMEDCSTDEWLQQKRSVADSGQSSTARRTSRDVDEAERSRRLAWVSTVSLFYTGRRIVRHIGMLAPDHFDICSPKQRPYDPLRSLQSVKSAEQRADMVEPRREYQPGGCIQYRLKSLKKVRRSVCQFALPKSSPEGTSETTQWWDYLEEIPIN